MSTFKEVVETYASSITNRLVVEAYFGNTFDEKVLNYKLRKHADSPRDIAKYLAAYVDYKSEEVKFVDIIESEFWRSNIHLKIQRTVIDSCWAYGYYNEHEEKYKYFTTSVAANVEPAYSKITVIEHSHRKVTKYTLEHTAKISTRGVPKVADIAIACGYHPAGYGCDRTSLEKLEDGTYLAKWQSSNSCD